MKAFLNASEAERLTGVDRHYIKQLVRAGMWPGQVISGRRMGRKIDRVMIPVAKLEELLGGKFDNVNTLQTH